MMIVLVPYAWNKVMKLRFLSKNLKSHFSYRYLSLFMLSFYYNEYFDLSLFILEQRAFDFLNRWTANKLDAVVVGME